VVTVYFLVLMVLFMLNLVCDIIIDNVIPAEPFVGLTGNETYVYARQLISLSIAEGVVCIAAILPLVSGHSRITGKRIIRERWDSVLVEINFIQDFN
jgi:hypothetical protein